MASTTMTNRSSTHDDSAEKQSIASSLSVTAIEKISSARSPSAQNNASKTQPVASTSTCILSEALQPSNVFQIYRNKDHNLTVRLADKKTVVYWVDRRGSLCADNSMHIRAGDPNGPTLAQITANTSVRDREKDILDIQWPGTEAESLMGEKAKAVHIQRDANVLGRRHKLQLSDGNTYYIEGATSKTVLSYWGGLRLVDADLQPVADFRCVWLKSASKVGTITVHGNPPPAWVEEVVLAILAVAHKEYRRASQWIWGIPAIKR